MSDFLQHIINGLSLGSIYALIALGYTMVYGIMQMINFAHSDVYMVGAMGSYYLSRYFGFEKLPMGTGLILALAGSVIVTSVLALTIEKLAYRPLRRAPKLNVLITAIGVSLLLQFGGQIIFGAEPKFYPQLIGSYVVIDSPTIQLRLIDLLVLLVTMISLLILHFFISKTRQGKAMRAVSQNPHAASLLGIGVNRMITLTFVVGAALAGIASVLVSMKYPKIDPMMGSLMGLKAFVAAVLGGIGNIPGAVLGAIIMGLSEEMVVAYVSSSFRDALAFLILILILLFKPSGLLGSKFAEKV